MKYKTICIFTFVVFIGFLIQPGCKTAEDAADYSLTVTTTGGVSGTPAAGIYTHAENDVVTYSYSLQPGYTNLTVTLDGSTIPASGTITVSGNHTLAVSADQIDIRGIWQGTFYFEGDSCYFRVEFSGGLPSGNTSGQFDWVGQTGNGEFTLSGNQIEFTLVFANGPVPADTRLTCTGILADENHMSGDWIYSYPGGEINGTWELNRN